MGFYEVPGMTLIPQKLTMSCWYASAQMLIQWRQDQVQQSIAGLVPTDFDAQCVAIRDGKAARLGGRPAVEPHPGDSTKVAAGVRPPLGERKDPYRGDCRHRYRKP